MILLSQTNDGENPYALISKQFNRGILDPENWTGIIVVLAGATIIGITLHFMLYYEKRKVNPQVLRSPQKLFREILGRLSLTARQRGILQKIARRLNEPHPAQMLLSPDSLAGALKRWQEKTGVNLYSQEMMSIGQILFPQSIVHPKDENES